MSGRRKRASSRASPTIGALANRTRYVVALAVVVTAAAVARTLGLFNDLWFDEIWSLRLVEQIHRPIEILTVLTHDNNHPLNSLFLFAMRPTPYDWTYRLLAWTTGVATVWLAALLGGRHYAIAVPDAPIADVRLAGLLSATLFGGSYLLIHYSSEARGYAPALAFALLAWLLLSRQPLRPWSPWAPAYWALSALGLLSHLSAIQVIAAGLIWSLALTWRSGVPWRTRLLHVVSWHAVPCAAIAAYAVGFLSRIVIGGGDSMPLGAALASAAAYTAGAPARGGAIALVLLAAISAATIGWLWRRDRPLSLFFFVALLFAPALTFAPTRVEFLYPRYFIVSAASALLLVSLALTRLWIATRTRPIAVIVLGLFLAGGAAHTARLARLGRGQYREAMAYVEANTTTSRIVVAGDQTLRNVMMIRYYDPPVGGRMTYYEPSRLPPQGPQWLFVERFDGEAPPDPDLYGGGGLHLRLARMFPHAALSGWDWYVYRRVGESPAP